MQRRLTYLMVLWLLAMGCQPNEEGPIKEKVTVGDITVPKGFTVEILYKPGENDQGSWVSITKDDKGRLYASDQYGNIYRVTLPTQSGGAVDVKKLDLQIGLAQGLLWHKGDMYALVNSNENRDLKIHSGFYKITDSDKDGEFDNVQLLRKFNGHGEHGPHNIELSPDGKSLYLVLGNHTDIPEGLGSVVPKVWDEDNLLPVIKDPSGHANHVKAPGGWVVKTDFEGKEWTIVNVGLRNTYDIAFNPDGELFGFDSDMEYDMGMPWYRPIRLCHLTSGGDFGWRTGTGKFDPEYPDNLPAVANLGQGSPTGLMAGEGLKFPAYYQNGFYLFDWSYGTMYFASLKPAGSTYTAEVTEFLSGVPLPLTNGIAGDDGAMYFLTGGRRLESALYKLTYTGEMPADLVALKANSEGQKLRALRQKLEALHTTPDKGQLDFVIDHLDHEDRFVRYAARVALEHMPYAAWKNAVSEKKSLLQQINFALAIARHGADADRSSALEQLLQVEWSSMNDARKTDYLRAIELLLIRMESKVAQRIADDLVDRLLPQYLSESDLVNKQLCQLLSYFQVADIIAPTLHSMETDTVTSDLKSIYLSGDVSKRSEQYGKDVENMLRNMPNQQNISYAKSLSVIEEGWTREDRERYFKWYNRALKKSGGKMYTLFIKAIQQIALAGVPEEDKQFFEALAQEEVLKQTQDLMAGVTQPKGPGKNWSVNDAVAAYKQNQVKVNFTSGENLFKASLCVSCHSVNGTGGNSGPELTQVGTRFSQKDLATAIIDPSETVSDRYRNIVYHLKNGSEVRGRLIDETDRDYIVSTNAFAPDITTRFRKSDVVKTEESSHSPMPPGLINRLNDQELADLLAYLISGGNKNHKLYNN